MPDSAVSSPTHPFSGRQAFARRLPIGTEYVGEGKSHVRVWAPKASRLTVVVGSKATALEREPDGYFSGAFDARPGTLYGLRPDDADRVYPDPASRFQPDGPHGQSEVVDPRAFAWTDASWGGATLAGQVIYECHVGTFTREGTWRAATAQLSGLADLGITMIEIMPIADFHGRFGWGYDGVDLFAPCRLYGRPDDLRQFVDSAHRLGIAVVLDVVYNHFGPAGNYLRVFSNEYFTEKYNNEWGDAINFDGEGSASVREFVLSNATYWIDEFHLDGLRLDATQQIFDDSPEHILRVIGIRAREAAGSKSIVLVAENEPQDTRLVRPVSDGGYGLDALWNDDFHHSAMVALTGRAEAYYSDTRGEPQEFISAAKYGYLFQGQHYYWQRWVRGTPTWGLPPAAFITYLQNHDQVANSSHGHRGPRLTSPGRWRAMTALLLLSQSTPMLFQGQEFASSAPFLYFADLEEDLAKAVRRGRQEFLTQFPTIVGFVDTAALADPTRVETFERCKLDFSERETHGAAYALHRDLLRLRRHEAFRGDRTGTVDGCVLAASAFALRFFTRDHRGDRLLIVNLGADLKRNSFAEPLLAPPTGCDWRIDWSSEDAAYGGRGTPDLWPADRWSIPGEAALLLAPGPLRDRLDARNRRRTA